MEQLPLCGGRVVFVDWQNVLSRDPFWTSILNSAGHPLHAALAAKLNEIFSHDSIPHAWMKGEVSTSEIIDAMGIALPKRFQPDYLARRLNTDIARMRVSTELVELLCLARTQAALVLATDNMDCFVRAFEDARAGRSRRLPDRTPTMRDWVAIWDDMVCSSDVRTLKAEDPHRFFGPWLTAHGLTFEEALLIDDRADNCAAFERQGGTTIRWKLGVNQINDAAEPLRRWLGVPATALNIPHLCR